MNILDIILGRVFMNRLRLKLADGKRTPFVQSIVGIYRSYIEAFGVYDNPFIQLLLAIVPVIDIFTLVPPYSLSGTVIVAILNFVAFRLVTNR